MINIDENTKHGFCIISGKPFHKGHENLINRSNNILKLISKNSVLHIFFSNTDRKEKKDQFLISGKCMEKIFAEEVKEFHDDKNINISKSPALNMLLNMCKIKSDYNLTPNNSFFYFFGRTNNSDDKDLRKMFKIVSYFNETECLNFNIEKNAFGISRSETNNLSGTQIRNFYNQYSISKSPSLKEQIFLSMPDYFNKEKVFEDILTAANL